MTATSDRKVIAKRVAICLLTLGAVFFVYWTVLPLLRQLLLPAPEPGGWVLGPAWVLRFGACTVLSALTLAILLRPIGKSWRQRDQEELSKPRDPFAGRPHARTALLIKGGLLFVVYLVTGAFYFMSYTEVTPSRLVIHGPLGARSYAYDQVAALERIAPVGGQPEKYAIRFDDGSWGYFSIRCEGNAPADIAAVATHVASRSGRAWVPVVRR